jgi:hypothetical protein
VYGPGKDHSADALLIAKSRQGERVIQSLADIHEGETLTLVGHGNATSLQLGDTTYNAQAFAEELQRLGRQPGDIEIIACRTAAAPAQGVSFADEVAFRTGVPVTAYSSDVYLVERAGGQLMVARGVPNDWMGRLFGARGQFRRAFLFHQPAVPDVIWYKP